MFYFICKLKIVALLQMLCQALCSSGEGEHSIGHTEWFSPDRIKGSPSTPRRGQVTAPFNLEASSSSMSVESVARSTQFLPYALSYIVSCPSLHMAGSVYIIISFPTPACRILSLCQNFLWSCSNHLFCHLWGISESPSPWFFELSMSNFSYFQTFSLTSFW